MKKSVVVLIVTLLLVVATALVQVTLALLKTETPAKANAFVPGVLTISTYENGAQKPNGDNGLTPGGNSAEKRVQFKNTDDTHEVDCYIRAMLVPAFRTNEGTLPCNASLQPTGGNIAVTAPDGGTVTLQLKSGWGDKWFYNNGYYYYKTIVHPGELTDVLLESVTVSDASLWNTFHLEVLSDAVQAENGAAAQVWGAAVSGLLEQP